MFKAVKFGKIRLGEGLQELRSAIVFKLNEDFLTAAVFSRLLYMPSEAFSALLMPDCGAELGKLRESTFWPAWGVKSRNGETSRVQPDLHVEFERVNLIVEAKLNDDSGCQTPRQWAREWAAWHQGEYAGAGTQPLLLGIGGFGTTDISTKATEIVEGANRLLQIDFPEVPAIEAVGLSWQELYDRLTSESWDDQISSQLVQDIREILGCFGLRRYQYLNDLGGMMRRSMINIIGPDSLDVVGRWHTTEREPDWLEASRLARPISGSSIGVFGR